MRRAAVISAHILHMPSYRLCLQRKDKNINGVMKFKRGFISLKPLTRI